jgi:hypothetical protein
MWYLKGKKGSILYLAIVILGFIFVVSSSLSFIIVSQLKIQREMGNSLIAFFAADSGVERALYAIFKENNLSFSTTSSVGSATFVVSVYPKSECETFVNYYCIKSKGIYRGTTRQIEASF